MKRRKLFALGSLVVGFCGVSFAAVSSSQSGLTSGVTSAVTSEVKNYGFLEPLDQQPRPWVPEITPELDEEDPAVDVQLAPYYQDFEKDGEVSFFVGYGYQSYYPERMEQIEEMLKLLATYYGVALSDWTLSDDRRTLRFRDANRGIRYVVHVEKSRNRFIRSFADHDVVIYHGHSRYGQGPAFESFQNYFRMGRVFQTIEMDAFNSYFLNEPLLKTNFYPVQQVSFNGRWYPFQYRGFKNKKSKLGWESYTKIIPGMDADFVKTKFADQKQMLFLYSCKNRRYFRNAVRARFPDTNQKLVFGTFRNGHGATRPTAVLIMSVIRRAGSSLDIVSDLNATKDCSDCFTAY